MRNTKEFYDLQNQFERDISKLVYGHKFERANNKEIPSDVFYNDGYVDTLFKVYMNGYSYSKAYNR